MLVGGCEMLAWRSRAFDGVFVAYVLVYHGGVGHT